MRRTTRGGLQEWVWPHFSPAERISLLPHYGSWRDLGRGHTVVFGSIFPKIGQENLFSRLLWLSDFSLLQKSFFCEDLTVHIHHR